LFTRLQQGRDFSPPFAPLKLAINPVLPHINRVVIFPMSKSGIEGRFDFAQA
jgi:hypothetical protein